MVKRGMSARDAFASALKELLTNISSIPLARQAHIAGWNYSLEKTPEIVAGVWNRVLPQELRVTADAFNDSGRTPSYLTSEEMKEIVRLRGGTLDPIKEGFDPFYEWKFITPRQSPLEIEQSKEYWGKRIAKSKKVTNRWGYGNNRYQGD